MKRKVNIQKLFRLAREERALSLLETAWTMWTLMIVLFGVVQCGLALYAYHFTSYAAQQGANFAQVRGYTWSKNTTTSCSTSAPPSFTMVYDCTASATDIQNYVQSLATGGIVASNATVNSSVWPGKNADGTTTGCTVTTTTNTNSEGCLAKVKVSYDFYWLPYLNLSKMTITATSEKTIMQ